MHSVIVVFDIDGTSVTSETAHQEAFLATCAAHGMPVINQVWHEYEHLTDRHIINYNYRQTFGRSMSHDQIADFEHQMLERMIPQINLSAMPGILSLISDIRLNPDTHYCFATGSLLKPAIFKLDRAKIPYASRHVIGSNGFESREEIVRSAIGTIQKAHSLQDPHIVSIGDGIWDVKTAQNLDVGFIGLGSDNRDSMRKAGCLHHFTDFQEISLDYLIRHSRRFKPYPAKS